MSLRHHEIAEANHRILDPFTEAKLRLLGEVAGVGPGTRVLDLACGKGEMLCRWAGWFGSGGVGVDLSEVFLAAAHERAQELGVGDRVSFVQGDAGAYEAAPGDLRHRELRRRDLDRRRAGRDDGAPAAGRA